MYTLMIGVFAFEGRPPQVVMMPFVQTVSRCEAMRDEQPDTIQPGMSIAMICYPLDGDKVESLRFSADAVLKGIKWSDPTRWSGFSLHA
jgi:hypothetical protein